MPFDLQILKEAGPWDLVGICEPRIPDERKNFFAQWLGSKKGPQMDYLNRRQQERLHPTTYFPQVQSILCFGSYYFPGWASGDLKISNYAWGRDYHEVLKKKCSETEKALKQHFPESQFRSAVDTAPVLEKVLAAEAGLGWQGKNTLLINPRFGSMIFLAEIFTNIPLDRFAVSLKMKDHCGTCRRCIDACPTQALSPYELDASKCISYWTLEHKGNFSSETPQWNEWLAGCDICQEVCPWNSKLIPLRTENPYEDLKPSDIETSQWTSRLQAKALSYVPQTNWKRNLKHVQRKS